MTEKRKNVILNNLGGHWGSSNTTLMEIPHAISLPKGAHVCPEHKPRPPAADSVTSPAPLAQPLKSGQGPALGPGNGPQWLGSLQMGGGSGTAF